MAAEPRLQAHVVAQLGTFALDVKLTASTGVSVLFGPSGSGKTSTLRCLAGLVPQASGFVRLDGRELGPLPPEERGAGYVFQSTALFPHLTVAQNVAFGAKGDAEVSRWMERLRLGELASRSPERLSGGERQRVALARALARSPQWLLLDEPFSSLDWPLRRALLEEVKTLALEQRLVTVLVTHSREDVELLGAQVIQVDGLKELRAASP